MGDVSAHRYKQTLCRPASNYAAWKFTYELEERMYHERSKVALEAFMLFYTINTRAISKLQLGNLKSKHTKIDNMNSKQNITNYIF